MFFRTFFSFLKGLFSFNLLRLDVAELEEFYYYFFFFVETKPQRGEVPCLVA